MGKGDKFGGTLDGLALAFIAVYLVAVMYQGHLGALWSQLKTDAGFLPWLVAVYILYLLTFIKSDGGVTRSIVYLAAFAFIVRTVANVGTRPFDEFAKGNRDVFTLAQEVVQGFAK